MSDKEKKTEGIKENEERREGEGTGREEGKEKREKELSLFAFSSGLCSPVIEWFATVA